MNSNIPTKVLRQELTERQKNFLNELSNPNSKTLADKARNAGYTGNNNTLSVTAKSTIKTLQKKGIINTFDNNGLTEQSITDNLKNIINRGSNTRVTATDALKAIELVMKARGDFNTKRDERTAELRLELDNLSNEELQNKLIELEDKKARLTQSVLCV